jgi:hypothetical protein
LRLSAYSLLQCCGSGPCRIGIRIGFGFQGLPIRSRSRICIHLDPHHFIKFKISKIDAAQILNRLVNFWATETYRNITGSLPVLLCGELLTK